MKVRKHAWLATLAAGGCIAMLMLSWRTNKPFKYVPVPGTPKAAALVAEAAAAYQHDHAGSNSNWHVNMPSGKAPRLAGMPPSTLDDSAADEPDPTSALAARWLGETQDNRWSAFQSTMHEVLDTALADPATAGSRLISLECRATLCRTEVELASPPALVFMDLGGRIQADSRLASATGLHHLAGNRAVIFTAPPGTSLE